MRFMVIVLFCLSLYGLEYLSYGELGDTKENVPPSSHLVSDTLWAGNFKTFKKHLATDPEAARTELQEVARKLFSGHELSQEWVLLYFRVSQDSAKHLSDVKRVSELEIRMLTAIDSKKYAAQIQQHKAVLTRHNGMGDVSQDHRNLTGTQGREVSHTTDDTDTPLETLKELVHTDPEAARAEIVRRGIGSGFGEHPLFEKWVSLVLKFVTTDPTLLEVTEFVELQLQMLKYKAAKTADRIKSEERLLGELNEAIKKHGGTRKTRVSASKLLH